MHQPLQRLLKRVVEVGVCRSGGAALARRLHAGDTIILAYHNIVPHGQPISGDRSLHLPQAQFARQLDALRRTHDIVPLSALAAHADRSRRPRAVITFDDAYRGAVTAGADELVARGLAATVFVAPAFVGGRSFWWDALAGAAGEIAADVRRHALEQLCGLDSAIRDWAAEDGPTLSHGPAHQSCATELELRALEGSGITLGSHSWTHPNLARLDPDALQRELALPLAWLTERFTNVVPWLAYPYGLSSPEVMAATAAAGYTGALRVDGGWTRSVAASPHDVPRQNIPAGISLEGFELRVSGVTG